MQLDCGLLAVGSSAAPKGLQGGSRARPRGLGSGARPSRVLSEIPLEEPRLLNQAAVLLLSSGNKTADDFSVGIQIDRRIIEQFCSLPVGTLDVAAKITPFHPTIK